MIFDYYKEVDGSPLTCIVSVDEELKQKDFSLPPYVQVYKDITD
jgi:hypothetical protein